MVRLQKVIYQKLFNGQSRVRNLSTPRKWFYSNPYQNLRLTYHQFLTKSLFGVILKPFIKWFNIIQMRINVDQFRQQGLTPEDRLLHLDKHLRRNVLFEHIARQTLHPYHWVLKSRRRERFTKIEMAAPGFFVPDYIRAEAQTQTFLDYLKLENEWASHVYNNYYSDITPQARRSVVPKCNPIQLIQNFGILRTQAWDRYFMNEHQGTWHNYEQLGVVRDHKVFPYDLTTKKGKAQFESQVNYLNQKVPGAIAPPGQKFDFNSYYSYLGV